MHVALWKNIKICEVDWAILAWWLGVGVVGGTGTFSESAQSIEDVGYVYVITVFIKFSLLAECSPYVDFSMKVFT